MIYFLFAISLLLYLGLRLIKVYYNYLETEYISKENKIESRSIFLRALKALFPNSFDNKNIEKKLNNKRKHKWMLGIIKGLSQFFAIFTIISFIFSGFQFWIDSTTNIELVKSTILQIEQTQHRIKDAINIFKFGDNYRALVIFLLIISASFFPLFEKFKLKEKFLKFNKIIKILLLFFAISTSFTFFGNRITSIEGSRLIKLEFHRLQIIESNKLLLQEVHNKVTEIVINEILSNDDIKDILDKKSEIKAKIESITQNEQYKEFINVASVKIINNLKVNTFIKTNNYLLNFQKDFSYKVNIYKSSSKSTSQTGGSNIYENFKSKNNDWSESKRISSNTHTVKEKFKRASAIPNSQYSKYYFKYKEPIDVLLRNAYGNTGKKWISGLLEFLKEDIPFLNSFIDPIINEPIEDFIINKTEAIFKNAFIGKEETIKQDLKICAEEFSNSFNQQTKKNKKLDVLKSKLTNDIQRVESLSNNTFVQIKSYNRKVDNYLNTISSNSRWERIRKNFRKRINYSNLGFESSQVETFKTVLDDWESYKNQNKFKWYNNKNIKIEEQFFIYSEPNSKLKACWGYVLQQQDWEGASYYYSNIARDASAKGNPYYLLKYYYNSTGKGEIFESLYDNETIYYVGEMCPPH